MPTINELPKDERWWVTASDGRRWPIIAGAEGEGEGDAGADGGEGEGEPPDDDADDDEEIRDPKAKIKSLTQANARLAKKLKRAEAALSDRGDGGDALRAARIETAFLREVLGRQERISDVETAWDLLNVRHFVDVVKVDEEGAVSGMAEALDALVARYPWAVEEPDDKPERPKLIATPKTPVRRAASQGMNRKVLEGRFPALGRGR